MTKRFRASFLAALLASHARGSFAPVELKTDGLTILDPGCVAKTYPGYWDALGSLRVRLEAHRG